MLFHSTLRKELSRSFGATLVVLATVVMTMMLIRTLGQASRGSVNPSDVLLVMGYTVLGQLPIILALSLFVAMVGTLSRLWRDSEMVIWFSSGRGLASFLSPMLRFAWPVLAAIAVLSLGVWPWANQQVQDMKQRYEQRGDVDRVAPGQFQESARGNRVFFIDRDTAAAKGGEPLAGNVFIASTDNGSESVTSARSARLETLQGERFVLLSNGQRLESPIPRAKPGDEPGAPAAAAAATKPSAASAHTAPSRLRISEFSEYGTRIGSASLAPGDAVAPRAIDTAELLAQPTPINQAELSWRIGLALAGLNFVLLALAVAQINPRAGRSLSLVFALFAFVVYYNLLNLGQGWIGSGRVATLPFVFGLHGGVAALAGLLLLARHLQWSWRPGRAR